MQGADPAVILELAPLESPAASFLQFATRRWLNVALLPTPPAPHEAFVTIMRSRSSL